MREKFPEANGINFSRMQIKLYNNVYLRAEKSAWKCYVFMNFNVMQINHGRKLSILLSEAFKLFQTSTLEQTKRVQF